MLLLFKFEIMFTANVKMPVTRYTLSCVFVKKDVYLGTCVRHFAGIILIK